MKLKKICKYEGKIKLITGLAIKGASNELNIGGADSEVVKNPLTGEPYIPGSSLKGKMRSQLERIYGMKKINKKIEEVVSEQVEPCGCGDENCLICRLFGAHNNANAKSAPTRIIVRDCELIEESRTKIRELCMKKKNYLELKAENIIRRDTGTVVYRGLRSMERVPAGLEFQLEILLQIFDGDKEDELKEGVKNALKMVEFSYLGGSGSRGYGQVEFNGKWKALYDNGRFLDVEDVSDGGDQNDNVMESAL